MLRASQTDGAQQPNGTRKPTLWSVTVELMLATGANYVGLNLAMSRDRNKLSSEAKSAFVHWKVDNAFSAAKLTSRRLK
jgi:hypothetical protein